MPKGAVVDVRCRDGVLLLGQRAGVESLTHWRDASGAFWEDDCSAYDIVAYRLHKPAEQAGLTGGKLSGNHYYRVDVAEPISPELKPYTAECGDIIEALGMTFNEGEAFKALWRLAAARQGRGKPGNKPEYDADKVAHYGGRVAVQTKRAGA